MLLTQQLWEIEVQMQKKKYSICDVFSLYVVNIQHLWEIEVMFYKGNVFQMWKKNYGIFVSTNISGKWWKLISVFCEKQLIAGELFSTVLRYSQFRKNTVFALKFAKDLFRLYVVKARLVRTGGHVLQTFVFRMWKKNYSFFS